MLVGNSIHKGFSALLYRRYLKKKEGATAVEFALLFFPFFLLIMGVIELSLFYASGVMLEGAAVTSSRLVRTGQAQGSADPQATFKDTMCNQVGVMINCDNIIFESINLGNSFTNASETVPDIDDDGNLVSAGFDAGTSNEVIMIRLAYRHEFLLPLIGQFLGDSAGSNSAQHLSTIVLRTEPYSF